MGDFRKKMSGSLSRGKKYLARKYLGKKYLSWRLMLEKILDSYTTGKKILTQTKSPIPLSKVKLSTPKQGARVKQRHFGGKT